MGWKGTPCRRYAIASRPSFGCHSPSPSPIISQGTIRIKAGQFTYGLKTQKNTRRPRRRAFFPYRIRKIGELKLPGRTQLAHHYRIKYLENNNLISVSTWRAPKIRYSWRPFYVADIISDSAAGSVIDS